MKMTTLYAALSGAFLLGAAALVPAQSVPSPAAKAVTPAKMENKTTGISQDEYKREKDRVEADAKAAKEKCKSMSGNAKDICQAEAKGTEKLAKKELDFKKNPNDKNRYDADKMKAEVAYEVAKEKCEDQKGAEQAACKKAAKADKDKVLAEAKASRKTVATNIPAAAPAARPAPATTAPTPSPATGGTGASTTKSTQGTSGK